MGGAAGLSWAGAGTALVSRALPGLSWCTDAPTQQARGNRCTPVGGCGLQLLRSLCQAGPVEALALLFKPVGAGDRFPSRWRRGVYTCALQVSAHYRCRGSVQRPRVGKASPTAPCISPSPTEAVPEPAPRGGPPLPLQYLPLLSGPFSKQGQNLGFCCPGLRGL